MKLVKSFLVSVISFSLFSVVFLNFTTRTIYAQDTRIALQRGFRTGYSDGYMSGYRDTIENAAKNYERHNEYAKADRAFNKDYGSLEDYRDGYQQGFESGYDTGFGKSAFDATIPASLAKRGVIAAKTNVETTTVAENTSPKIVVETVTTSKVEQPVTTEKVEETVSENVQPANNVETTNNQTTTITTPTDTDASRQLPIITTRTQVANTIANGETTIRIPTDTELIVELLDDINTERNLVGDRFQARVISPNEINGAIIEGRISKIQKPGRLKRRSEVLLSFDRIILSDNRWSNFNAILTEVLPIKGDNVKRVDTEGTVEGKSSIKTDSIKIGATTGTGLVVGAIAGGPVGAAVGAGVGAAFGVGAVVVERGKYIQLNRNQQLRIKSAYETQIR